MKEMTKTIFKEGIATGATLVLGGAMTIGVNKIAKEVLNTTNIINTEVFTKKEFICANVVIFLGCRKIADDITNYTVDTVQKSYDTIKAIKEGYKTGKEVLKAAEAEEDAANE